MGHRVANEPYHLAIIKTQLTRKLPTLCPIIEDELSATLGEMFSLQNDEWKPVVALQANRHVPTRTQKKVHL
ncbi:hypothetical protein EDD17DRAFT_1671873 [Pisolithus thermaeus]|nr:hypothetical protein EDD17DRAFT_1671873 [Pisolithus thermaeus]